MESGLRRINTPGFATPDRSLLTIAYTLTFLMSFLIHKNRLARGEIEKKGEKNKRLKSKSPPDNTTNTKTDIGVGSIARIIVADRRATEIRKDVT